MLFRSHQKRAAADQRFQPSVGDQPAPPGERGRDASGHERAERHPAHVRGEHRARGSYRVPHLERQQPRPRDLVQQAGRTGDAVNEKEQAAKGHGGPRLRERMPVDGVTVEEASPGREHRGLWIERTTRGNRHE